MHMLDCLSISVPGHNCLSQCKKDLQQIPHLVDFDPLFVVFFHQSGWLHSLRPQESWKEISDLEKSTKRLLFILVHRKTREEGSMLQAFYLLFNPINAAAVANWPMSHTRRRLSVESKIAPVDGPAESTWTTGPLPGKWPKQQVWD